MVTLLVIKQQRMVTTLSCAKLSRAPHKLNAFPDINYSIHDELNDLHNAKLNRLCIIHKDRRINFPMTIKQFEHMKVEYILQTNL